MAVSKPWRDPKTGVWKLRKRVPTRYWPVAGDKIIKISTHKTDKGDALKAWTGVLELWAQKEAQWERELKVVSLTPQAASELAAGWAAWVAVGGKLETGGTDATRGCNSDIFEPLDLPECHTPDRLAIMWARVEAHADEALKLKDIAIQPETRPVLLQTMLPVVRDAYLEADLRSMGMTGSHKALNPLTTARAALPAVTLPQGTLPVKPGVTFESILRLWRGVTTVKARVAGDMTTTMGMLQRFLEHDDAAKVTTADLRAWRDATKAEGLSNNTWNRRLSMVGSVFAQAAKDGLLPTNPAAKVLRLATEKANSPLPYSDEDAARILITARTETRASIRWVPWLMAFTGMRVGEAIQLYVSDIRVDGGIHYISVNQDDPGKSVKTSERRNIPIHSALISEGLLEYAATMPPGQLFPDKKPDRYGMIGGRAYNVVGRWVRETVGIIDEKYAPNHSWRHRMEDELRDNEVDEEVRDTICGHTGRTTGRLYGVKGVALRRLKDAIEKIQVPLGVN